MRALIKRKSVAPHWINIVTGFMKTGPGKIIMYNEFDPVSKLNEGFLIILFKMTTTTKQKNLASLFFFWTIRFPFENCLQ